MATAAKSISPGPVGVEAGLVPLPGAAELFAAMIAGVNGEESPGEGGMPSPAPEETVDDLETTVDASVLLPMLDQQRAATPAAKLTGAAVDAPSPVTCMIAPTTDPAPAEAGVPAIAGERAGEPASDPAPVMRPLPDGKAASAAVDKGPAENATSGGMPTSSAVGDPTPVMRPLPSGKAAPGPVIAKGPAETGIHTGKPIPASKASPTPAVAAAVAPAMPQPEMHPGGELQPAIAPVMRPIGTGAPKADAPQPVTPTVKLDPPAAPDGPSPPGLRIVQPAIAPIVAEPAVADGPPLPAAAAQPLPQAKTPGAKATPPETTSPQLNVAVAETQAAPVAAKARMGRVDIAPVTNEATQDISATTPVTATATETRAAVQPVHAAPSLVQPLAVMSAPMQNVAAALSQQVLDMSGGDAWIDQIARDISQTAGKDGTMRFRLAPETLGELKVEITHSERGAHVRLNVSSEGAQQALAAAEHKLAAEARAQGVRIAETEINFTGGQSRDASSFAREQGQQAQQQAQANQQPRMSRGNSANSFTSSAAAPEGRGRTDRYA